MGAPLLWLQATLVATVPFCQGIGRTGTGAGASLGILARSELVLPANTPCPWDYEECTSTTQRDCIGPSKWGEVCEKAYGKCGSGLRQSPIDIDMVALLAKEYTPHENPLKVHYTSVGKSEEPPPPPAASPKAPVEVKSKAPVEVKSVNHEGGALAVHHLDAPQAHTPHHLQSGARFQSQRGEEGPIFRNTGNGLQIGGAFGLLKCDEDVYNAIAVHFHSPSEHTRKGEQFPLEVQIVHQKKGAKGTEDLFVVSFLFESCDEAMPNPFLEQIGAVPPFESKVNMKAVDLNLLDGIRGSYVRYSGSVTTPPCDETVTYFIMAETQQAAPSQLAAFSAAVGATGNARPTQPIAERVVEFVDVTQYHADQWNPSLSFTNQKAKDDMDKMELVTPDLD